MYQRKGYWFSPEERIAIVREFEKGGMTLTQIQSKYGIKGHSTVYRWRQDLHNSKKCVSLHSLLDGKGIDQKFAQTVLTQNAFEIAN